MKVIVLYGIALILALGVSACRVNGNINGKVVVDNTVLNYENSARITELFAAPEFELDLGFADVNLRGAADNKLDLIVRYKEYSPADATILIRDGKLSYETKSGKPAAIMSVSGTIPGNISLEIETGSGDVQISQMRGKNRIEIDSGSGDLEISESDLALLDVDTGSGDVDIVSCLITDLVADTGSGDVSLSRSQITNADLDTGSGDIILNDSEITYKKFETGSGKVQDGRGAGNSGKEAF